MHAAACPIYPKRKLRTYNSFLASKLLGDRNKNGRRTDSEEAERGGSKSRIFEGKRVSKGIRTRQDFDRGKVGALEREASRTKHNRKLSMSLAGSSRSLLLYKLSLSLSSSLASSLFFSWIFLEPETMDRCMHGTRNIWRDGNLSTISLASTVCQDVLRRTCLNSTRRY